MKRTKKSSKKKEKNGMKATRTTMEEHAKEKSSGNKVAVTPSGIPTTIVPTSAPGGEWRR